MKFTNNLGLPDFVVSWLKHDSYDYDSKAISATSLLKPTRMLFLEKKYAEQLEMDVADLVAPKYGTALHESFEKISYDNITQEQRLYAEINDTMISGKYDMLETRADGSKKLIDIKSTSVWSYIYGSRDEDYIAQLSIYKWLLSMNGTECSSFATICYCFTDWAGSKARMDSNYPQSRVATKNITLWSIQETADFIQEKTEEIKQSHGDNLPDCSPKDLWGETDKWAVMKKNNIRAVRVLDDEKKAIELAETLGSLHSVTFRPGKVRRCNYCKARPFCEQYKQLKERGLIIK